MKKTLVLGMAIGLVSMAAATVFANPSADQGTVTHLPIAGDKNVGAARIVGSSHDLSNVGNKTGSQAATLFANGGDNLKRICIYCHHTHNAFAATGNLGSSYSATVGVLTHSPLWNHNLAATSFTGYDNGIRMGANAVNGTDKRHALNAHDAGGGTRIAGVSLLCMSCHDGVVAMNTYSQATGSPLNAAEGDGSAISTTAAFKGTLNNHHPMGFNYADVQAEDKEIAAPTVVVTPDSDITIGDLLCGANSTMECVTCHDVHNVRNQVGAERFLWRTNDQSNFCLTCHLK